MITIALADSSKVAVVDERDAHLVAGYRWRCLRGYAYGRVNGKIVPMHRMIIDAKPGEVVDHLDGNRLNNTRANLRTCTQKENSRRRHALNSNNTSGYQGVNFDKQSGKWRARIKVDGKFIVLGLFRDIKVAAAAYAAGAIKYHGENHTRTIVIATEASEASSGDSQFALTRARACEKT